VPEIVRWWHWVASVDSIGRVRLPAQVRPTEDESPELLASSRDRSLVLRQSGPGTPRPVDDRGRLTLPAWLRRLVGPGGAVLVSASVPDTAVIVVTPTAVLDEVVDGLAGEVDR
jgi:bifunctional DNA-binding transcriptional regulator/antitoxin component of YhaV-PrlF toxin-antitoxin module